MSREGSSWPWLLLALASMITGCALSLWVKYRNVKTNGYDSKAEARRAAELELLERQGFIETLKKQVRFNLIPKQKGERAVDYVADFTYFIDGRLVVEDVKGVKTPVYILKRKLMKFLHGIDIQEVA